MENLRSKADQEGTSVTELVTRFIRQGLDSSVEDRMRSMEEEIRILQMQQRSGVSNSLASKHIILVPNDASVQLESEIQSEVAELKSELNSLKEMISSQLSQNTQS